MNHCWIKIDKTKNRLYLNFKKIESKEDCCSMVTEVESTVRHMKQGFSCISDLRGFTYDDHDFMQSIQETLWDAGVKIVVRVVESQEREASLFNHEKKSMVWPAYLVETAEDIESAENILEMKNM